MSGPFVRNAYGSLKRVIVHRPGPELDKVTSDNLEEFHFTRPVDREKFVADYDAMLGLFQGHGRRDAAAARPPGRRRRRRSATSTIVPT